MVSSIHHIAFTVKDLKESLDWYRRILGFTEVKSYHDEEMDIILLKLNLHFNIKLYPLRTSSRTGRHRYCASEYTE